MMCAGVRGLFQSSASVRIEMTNDGLPASLSRNDFYHVHSLFTHELCSLQYSTLTMWFSAASHCILLERWAARNGCFLKCAFPLLDLFTFCLFLQLPLSHRKVLWAPLCTVGRLEDQQSTHKSTENKAGDAVTIPKKTTKKQSNSAG